MSLFGSVSCRSSSHLKSTPIELFSFFFIYSMLIQIFTTGCEDPSISKRPWETPPQPIEVGYRVPQNALNKWDEFINYFRTKEEGISNYYFSEKKLEAILVDGTYLRLTLKTLPLVNSINASSKELVQEQVFEYDIFENSKATSPTRKEKGYWRFKKVTDEDFSVQLMEGHQENSTLLGVISIAPEFANQLIFKNVSLQQNIPEKLIKKEFKFPPFDTGKILYKINCYNSVKTIGAKIRILKTKASSDKSQNQQCVTLYEQIINELLNVAQVSKSAAECSEKEEILKNQNNYQPCETLVESLKK